jgi:hypothetical protein
MSTAVSVQNGNAANQEAAGAVKAAPGRPLLQELPTTLGGAMTAAESSGESSTTLLGCEQQPGTLRAAPRSSQPSGR